MKNQFLKMLLLIAVAGGSSFISNGYAAEPPMPDELSAITEGPRINLKNIIDTIIGLGDDIIIQGRTWELDRTQATMGVNGNHARIRWNSIANHDVNPTAINREFVDGIWRVCVSYTADIWHEDLRGRFFSGYSTPVTLITTEMSEMKRLIREYEENEQAAAQQAAAQRAAAQRPPQVPFWEQPAYQVPAYQQPAAQLARQQADAQRQEQARQQADAQRQAVVIPQVNLADLVERAKEHLIGKIQGSRNIAVYTGRINARTDYQSIIEDARATGNFAY